MGNPKDIPMGIYEGRFIDDNYKLFMCRLCGFVAEDPVLFKCCELTACRACFNSSVFVDVVCHPCGHHTPDTKMCELQKQLRLLYSRLKMKCLNEDCKETLLLETYKEHDKTCPFKKCPDCELKGLQDDHDCVRELKSENLRLVSEMEEVKKELVDTKGLLSMKQNGINNGIADGTFDGISMESGDKSTREIPALHRFMFNDIETTANKLIKNIVKNNYILSIRKDRQACGALCMKLKGITGENWIVQPKSMINLTKYRIPRHSFCSFKFDNIDIVAFEGSMNVDEPAAKYIPSEEESPSSALAQAQDMPVLKNPPTSDELIIVRDIYAYRHRESFSCETRKAANKRNKRIGEEIVDKFGGYGLSITFGSAAFVLHSSDEYNWKCYTYSVNGDAVNPLGVRSIEFVPEKTNVDTETRKAIIRSLIECSCKGLLLEDLVKATAERIKGYTLSEWKGYMAEIPPQITSKIQYWAAVKFFLEPKFFFSSDGLKKAKQPGSNDE